MKQQTRLLPPHILQVEDNPGDVLMLAAAFKECAIACLLSVVKDGWEALRFIHREGEYANAPRPDLILLDLNLPRVTGHEVLTILKSEPAYREIPVIVLTSSGSRADITQAYSLYANCYLLKPLDLDEVLKQVRSLQEFWLRQAVLPGKSVGAGA